MESKLRTQKKIRKEKNGAYQFDVVNGKVSFISEEILKSMKRKDDFEIIYPKVLLNQLPNDCFAAPSKVYIELTRKCTLNCTICYNKSGKQLKNELTTSELFRLFDELATAGTFEVRFTGGEPTTRKDFFELVEYAKNKGFFVSIGTNGIWDDKIIKKIADSRLDMVIISIEGPPEINDRIRGKGMLGKAVNSIEYLSKNTDKQIRINMTIAKYNLKALDYVAQMADKFNVPVINTMPIRLSGRSTNLSDQVLSQKDYLEFVKDVEKIRKKRKVSIQTYFDILGEQSRWLENQTSLINKKTCAAGVEACIISPIGDVYGCAASNASDPNMNKDEKKMFIAGNIRNEDFMDIWLDSRRWKIYRNLELNKSKRCHSCEHYSKKCFGNCFISSYFHDKKLNSPDPYCFVGLIKKDLIANEMK